MEKPLYKRIISYKTLLGIAVCWMLMQQTYAQFVYDYKKSADNYYTKGDYYSAAVYYEKYLEQQESSKKGRNPYVVQDEGKPSKKSKASKGVNKEEIISRIADSYSQLNDYTQAEKWYAQLTATENTATPYQYGIALRANGKYQEAQQQFEKYIAGSHTAYKEQAKQELRNTAFIQSQINRPEAALYTVNKIEGTINPGGANYAAVWNNNTLFFTSTRADSTQLKGKKDSPFKNKIYQATVGNAGYDVQKVEIPTDSDLEQGVAAVNPQGNKLFLTRWTTKEGGAHQASIYISELKDGSWTAPVKLGQEINIDGYSSQQPSVTADGKYLLFSSDRPGGSGSFDIWYAALDADGNPGKAVNFGKIINTAADEQAPFYHEASKTLVFASKGRVGMGGLDLYQANGTIGGSWKDVQNMGYPVNSSKDDIYFIAKGNGQLLNDAVISSDRASACCLELFAVNKAYKKYVAGIVADSLTGEPLAGVQLVLDNKALQSSLRQQSTDATGKYVIELDEFVQLGLTASKENYHSATIKFNRPTSVDADTLHNERILLVKIKEPKKRKERKAYFGFDKYELNQETLSVLDELVDILKREESLDIEITGYTDKVGSVKYNMNLSKQRAEACKAYMVSKGIAANRIEAVGKGKCCVSNNDAEDRKAEFRMLLAQ